MKLKNFKYVLGCLLVFFSFSLAGEELRYQFQWLSIPVAELFVNNNTTDNNLHNSLDVKFKISTKGPLKIFRNYFTDGYIKKNTHDSWDYYLSGKDRGQSEEKLITYFRYKAPNIKIFIDDRGVSPVKIDPYSDRGAVDPFTILVKIIQQLKISQDCNDSFFLIDGKRRYQANVVLVEEELNALEDDSNYSGLIYHCKLTILGNKFMTDESRRNIWPFDGSDKIIDMWFAEELDYSAVKFQFKSPLGKIIGKLIR